MKSDLVALPNRLVLCSLSPRPLRRRSRFPGVSAPSSLSLELVRGRVRLGGLGERWLVLLSSCVSLTTVLLLWEDVECPVLVRPLVLVIEVEEIALFLYFTVQVWVLLYLTASVSNVT